MIFVCVTEIDADTKVPCTVEAQRTGPSLPELKGLSLDWANKSTWPVEIKSDGSYAKAPKYYGTCDDDADVNIAGVLEIISEQEWSQRKHDEFYARRPFESWEWNSETFVWSSPVPYPTDDKRYIWNELTTSWVLENAE
jgi:hypothetical protein